MGDFRQELNAALEIANERQPQYGSSYKQFHKQMNAFFPNGVELKTEKDFELYSHFQMCVVKLNRYAMNINNGGHKDSAVDLINFAAMLSEASL